MLEFLILIVFHCNIFWQFHSKVFSCSLSSWFYKLTWFMTVVKCLSDFVRDWLEEKKVFVAVEWLKKCQEILCKSIWWILFVDCYDKLVRKIGLKVAVCLLQKEKGDCSSLKRLAKDGVKSLDGVYWKSLQKMEDWLEKNGPK